MKLVILICALNLFSFSLKAQVGIGTTNPDAQLDISASNSSSPTNTDGILIPRVSNLTASGSMTANQDGMLVFYTGSGLSGKGFYYWNQTTTSWVPVTNSDDADWYSSTTSTAPNSINDNIYTNGNVTISSLTNVSNGLSVDKTINTNTISTLRNANIQTTLNGSTRIDNIRSDIFGSGTGNRKAFASNLNGTGSGRDYAFYSSFGNSNSTEKYGLYNYFNSNANAIKYGVRNEYLRPQNGLIKGVYTTVNADAGTIFGSHVQIENGNGTQYGAYLFLNEGTGSRYGIRSTITGNSGSPYGIYSDVENLTSGYAGYFVGRTSLGNTTINRYIMPATDGIAGQVMTTDGAGNVSWAAPSAQSGISSFNYPDGLSNIQPIILNNLNTTAYTVPAGKNLYITNMISSSNSNILYVNGIMVIRSVNNWLSNQPQTNPILVGSGETLTATQVSSTLRGNGFLIDANVTPLTFNSNYTVPAGKILVILNYTSLSSNSPINLVVDGLIVYRGTGNFQSNTGYNSFFNPFFASAGQAVNPSGGTINGYLMDL